MTTKDMQPNYRTPRLRQVPRSSDIILPLSFAQERMWFLNRLEPDNPFYNVHRAIRITGKLNIFALEQSFNEVVRRHEVFRTTYSIVSGCPVPVIAPKLIMKMPVVDLRRLPEEEREERVIHLANKEARRPFDLSRGPLLRISLLRLENKEYVLQLTTHHFVTDGWSMRSVFMKELSILYDSFSQGKASPLPELPVQYADFAYWERQRLKGDFLKYHMNYWKKQLQYLPTVLKIPTDRPRPKVQTYQGASHKFTVSEATSDALKTLSRKENVTLFMTILTAVQILLHRYTGQTDIVIGTAISNRNHYEIENVIGPFTNILVLRSDLSNNPSFKELLGRVRKMVLEAYKHQELPFELLLKKLQPKRSLRHNPLFQVMFVFHQYTQDENLKLSGCSLKRIPIELGTTRFDLNLDMAYGKNELSGWMDYSTDLFNHGTIFKMFERFGVLLNSIVKNPKAKISDLWNIEEIELPDISTAIYNSLKAPLTYHQESLFFIDQFETGDVYESSPTYHNLSLIIHLAGHIDCLELKHCFSDTVRLHDILQTSIGIEKGTGCQVLQNNTNVKPIFEECRTALDGSIPETATKLALKEVSQPFDILRNPLIRAKLYRITDADSLLVIIVHHIIADKESLRILARDLMENYKRRVSKRAPYTRKPDLSFKDYACWQRNISEDDLESHIFYWKYQLRGKLERLDLPLKAPRPAVLTFTPSHYNFTINGRDANQISSFCTRKSFSEFAVFLTAFILLLHIYSKQKKVLVGIIEPCRSQSALKNIVGSLANSLVIQSRIEEELPIRILLEQVTKTVKNARHYREMPFDKLVQILNPEKDMSHNALFDILFQYESYQTLVLETDDVKARIIDLNLGHGKFDINLLIQRVGERLYGKVVFNADLYSFFMIKQMMRHFLNILDTILFDINRPISKINLLSKQEKFQQIVKWNPDQLVDSQVKTIHQLFEEQAGTTPNTIAVRYKKDSLTYRELDERANQLAHFLINKGVGPDILVAVFLKRSIEMIVTLVGILKAGGAYLPLDPDYPKERLDSILSDSSVSHIISTSNLIGNLPKMDSLFTLLDNDFEKIVAQPLIAPSYNSSATDLAYCMYTSGSTGRPKGVLIEHKNVVRLFSKAKSRFDFTEKDVWSLFHSYSFDFSVWEIFGALLSGGRLVVIPPEVTKEPSDFAKLIKREKITILNLTPTLFQTLKKKLLKIQESDLSIRYLIFGGEALFPSQLNEWKATYPDIKIINMYGITETAVHATFKEISIRDIQKNICNIGKPLPKTTIYIMDSQLRLLPVGVPGEICIGGEAVGRGYLNRAELNHTKFITNPYKLEEKLYRSGDIARFLPNGELVYLGRSDDQVQVRGYRVELGEIKNTLLTHPQVSNAFVISKLKWDSSEIIAYVVPACEVSISSLRNHLSNTLPAYMIPSRFELLDSLPIFQSGKVDRKALPEPGTERPDLEKAYVAPRNPIEEKLAKIWETVLNLKQIGINDNFFELGGHSLLAIQLMYHIKKVFQIELPLRSLFEMPTVSDLATKIHLRNNRSKPSLNLPTIVAVPDLVHIPFPLTDIQQAYWLGRNQFFELGNVGSHCYLEFECIDISIERLNTALLKLIQLHGMLRAIVLPEGQQQILERVSPYKIEVQDLRGHSYDKTTLQLNTVRKRMSSQVLPTDKWPLFEIRASRLDDNRFLLHCSFDALILDALSKNTFFAEWGQIYQNPNETLPPHHISFRDYVLGEVAFRDSAIYAKSKKYWENRISKLPPPPELPLKKEPTLVKDPRFVMKSADLEDKTWHALKNRAAQHALTPSVLLITVFSEVLSLWSKNKHFTLNITSFNRIPMHPEVDRILGDFTSGILLEVNNFPNDTFENQARRLQKQFWEDMDHRYFSGVEVLRELRRYTGGSQKALMPIVFTSLLTHDKKFTESKATSWLGKIVDRCYQTPQVWFDHVVAEEGERLKISWNIVEELFPDGLIDDMFISYKDALKRLAIDEKFWHIKWVERSQQLIPPYHVEQIATINATEIHVPDDLLQTLFSRTAHEYPDMLAIITSEKDLTYRELDIHSNRVGYKLRMIGAQPNKLVAVLMEKGWEQVVAVIGILFSGAAYLPIDPQQPEERIKHILRDGQVDIVLTQSWLDNKLKWPKDIKRLCIDTETFEDFDDKPLKPLQNPDDLAYVIYTSGSTGLPKGVMIDHRGAVNTILDINRRFGVGIKDRSLALSSLHFDLSVYDIFGMLAAGGSIVISKASKIPDPKHWAELIVRKRVTIWNSVPQLMEILLEYANGQIGLKSSSIRLVMLSGDWIAMELPERIKSLLGGIELIALGGATEASIWSLFHTVQEVNPAYKRIPYGKPLANQSVYILDETLSLCPAWVTGQIYIGGTGLAKGYWDDEKKTHSNFIHHPETGKRLYRTGDLGRYLPDGNIDLLGREDLQVKIRGYRVELEEIEASLRKHHLVKAAVVKTVGGSSKEKHLIAYVVPSKRGFSEIKNESIKNIKPENNGDLASDSIERLKFKLSQPGLRKVNLEQTCTRLIKPELNKSFREKFVKRRSYRRFSQQPIGFEQFSVFFSCLCQIDLHSFPLPKYQYASAGSLYPVQIYFYIKPERIEGINEGIFYYHPINHSLVSISPDVKIDRKIYSQENRSIFDASAFSIFLIGQMSAIRPIYGEDALRYALLEAGLITQLLETSGPDHNIGLCQIGDLDFKLINHLFNLDKTHVFLHHLLGGRISTEGKKDQTVNLPDFTLFSHPSKEREPNLYKEHSETHRMTDRQITGFSLEKELHDFLRKNLPEYMLPSTFVIMKNLPVTLNGKIDRKALPDPKERNQNQDESAFPPNNETENAIAEIWQQVLDIEKVSIDDNFFDLGGHSMLLVQVQRKLQKRLNIELSLIEIFEYPTICLLARHIHTKDNNKNSFHEIFKRAEMQVRSLNRSRNVQKGRVRAEDE